jgi:hypothetical protein
MFNMKITKLILVLSLILILSIKTIKSINQNNQNNQNNQMTNCIWIKSSINKNHILIDFIDPIKKIKFIGPIKLFFGGFKSSLSNFNYHVSNYERFSFFFNS